MPDDLSNEIRLEKMRKEHPLVSGDEKIAVFGAGGQIGTKLKPLLDKLYPGQVIYCESPNAPRAAAFKKQGFTLLDITREEELKRFLQERNVKVVINLAALLSAAADKNPEAAHKVNFLAPLHLLEIASEAGVRKVQMMSSMAAQEFDRRLHDSDEVAGMKQKLRKDASNTLHARPDSRYGMQKTALENAAEYYAHYRGLDVSIPRLAGVMNAHLPWPSDGTTEELDKLVVAAAMHKIYGDRWEEKMRVLIGESALCNGCYLKDGKYVPQVSADAVFDMIDGQTLPQATLMLLHQDLRPHEEISVPGAVHNLSEYSISMQQAADIIARLNPDFPLAFATEPSASLDRGKMAAARSWPTSQNTHSTEALIGNFKQYSAEQSIRAAYENAVRALKSQALADVGRPPATGAARAQASN